MKGSILWTAVIVAAVAGLGTAAYRSLGPIDPTAIPRPEIGAAADGRASNPGLAGPTKGAPAGTARGFRFGPPNTRPNDVAEVRFVGGGGRPMRLANFRGKGVLLNIWATWCGPCREEMPTLDRLQARLGGADFEVVALSIDGDGAAAVRDFYAELGLKSLGIYVDSSTKAANSLNVLGIPTTLLFDPDGREIGRYTGPAEWDGEAVVETILGHLEAAPSPGARAAAGS